MLLQLLNKNGSTGEERSIAEGILSVGQNAGGNVHAFLIDDGSSLTLIDTLWDNDGAHVVRAIEGIGRRISDLQNIVITHAHRAHLGGLAALKKRSGARVFAHEWEADIIAGQRKAQAVTPIPRRPFRAYHLQLGLALGFGSHAPCQVDAFIREGDRIGPLEVLHTPGHSPGHLALYWRERNALFAGDTLATWPWPSLGWQAFNLNEQQHRQSLLKIDDLRPDILAVGHGRPATGDEVDILLKLIRSNERSNRAPQLPRAAAV